VNAEARGAGVGRPGKGPYAAGEMGSTEPEEPSAAELNARGIELAENGEYAAAERWFRRAAETGSPDAWLNLGRLLAILGRFADALQAYREAGRLGMAAGYLLSGDLLHAELDDVEAAKTEYRKAIEMGDVDAWVNLGVTFESEGDFADARAAYESAVRLGDRAANWQLAELLVRMGADQELVEPAYREAIEGGEDRALLGLGLVLHGRGALFEAEPLLRKAVERDVESAHAALGVLLEARHLRGEAETTYRAGMEHGDGAAALNLGNLLTGDERFAEAETAYARAIGLGEVDAYNNLGALHLALERDGEAEEALRNGAAAGDALAARNYAALLLEAERIDEAEVALEVAIRGGDATAVQMLADLRES
jgi:tetratricopeptide (TPR) repeat protein